MGRSREGIEGIANERKSVQKKNNESQNREEGRRREELRTKSEWDEEVKKEER